MRADDSRLEAAAPPGKAAGRQDWLRAARAAGLTPLAALMAVAHICPSHRARQTPLDGQGRRRSEWGFRRRRPARGSQRAASTHVRAATAEIFLDPAVARFPDHWPPSLPSRAAVFSRRLHISPAGEPESPLGLPLPWRRVRWPVRVDVSLPRHRQLAPPIGVPRCLSPQLSRRRVVNGYQASNGSRWRRKRRQTLALARRIAFRARLRRRSRTKRCS